VIEVVDMKTNPEKYKEMKDKENDIELWDKYFGGM